jgi:hypothetical protein
MIPVALAFGFNTGQAITIGSGADAETAIIAGVSRRGARNITVSKPLKSVHASGDQVSGSGIALTTALRHAHARDASVAGNAATPDAPNQYEAQMQ